MTIKEKLNEIRENAKEQRSIIWQIQDLADKIDTIRGVGNKMMTIRTFGCGTTRRKANPTEEHAIEVIDNFEEEYLELCTRLEELKEDIKECKTELKNLHNLKTIKQNEYDVINLFYFEGLSVEEIAEAMYYSMDWIQEMKAKAIKKWQQHENTHKKPREKVV